MTGKSILSKIVARTALGVFALSSVACLYSPKQMAVTYRSYPANAALFRGNTNQQIGMAPQTVPYTVSVEEQKQGFKMLPAVTARWVSGAVASTEATRVDLTGGYSQEFTLVRPPDAPGVEIDASFAADHARNKIEAERNDIMLGRITE